LKSVHHVYTLKTQGVEVKALVTSRRKFQSGRLTEYVATLEWEFEGKKYQGSTSSYSPRFFTLKQGDLIPVIVLPDEPDLNRVQRDLTYKGPGLFTLSQLLLTGWFAVKLKALT